MQKTTYDMATQTHRPITSKKPGAGIQPARPLVQKSPQSQLGPPDLAVDADQGAMDQLQMAPGGVRPARPLTGTKGAVGKAKFKQVPR
jgi:hypothetical protein